jgi:TonB family protein
VNLRISWSQFRQIYGDGELERQRQEIAEQRRSKTRGHYRKNWERVRASIENYVPHVRAGNQTALRAAQSPFAAYLSHVHQKIHRYWADGFLVDLLALGDQHPLNDPNLRTDLEIVIAPDGQVAEVGVVRSSGQLAFDAAAVDSAYRSGPHPSPPDVIKSGDGRVYFHWGFYRNARQCGTFNATPYLLPDPPNLPRDSATQPRPGGAQPPRTEPQPDRGTPAAPPPREVAEDAAAG